jgi:hypothetical protein
MDVTLASTVGRGAGNRAVPPRWRANPSAWAERLPIAGAALVGFAVDEVLASLQHLPGCGGPAARSGAG